MRGFAGFIFDASCEFSPSHNSSHSLTSMAQACRAAQRVSVMNLDELNETLRLHFDGLIGQDVLQQFRYVRIDYRARVIELRE
jgi:hypothetical protein